MIRAKVKKNVGITVMGHNKLSVNDFKYTEELLHHPRGTLIFPIQEFDVYTD
jgi:hypothetical protein